MITFKFKFLFKHSLYLIKSIDFIKYKECYCVINCYLTIRGGSLKKIEKKIIPKVPINKKV